MRPGPREGANQEEGKTSFLIKSNSTYEARELEESQNDRSTV